MSNQAEREMKILEFMRTWIIENEYPPTVRDICAALDIKSTSTVHKALVNLEQQGYIRKDPVKKRALKVIDLDADSKAQGQSNTAASKGSAPGEFAVREDIVDVPVVGRIAAGEPILAEQNIEDSFPVPSRFLGRGNNFMLRVQGDSMINAGIFNGDFILIEECSTARNGEIVAAMVEGYEYGATVKKFYKENGHIRLQPENDDFDPIIVDDCTILGKVKGVFRYFN